VLASSAFGLFTREPLRLLRSLNSCCSLTGIAESFPRHRLLEVLDTEVGPAVVSALSARPTEATLEPSSS
jgi:hypothetical protein